MNRYFWVIVYLVFILFQYCTISNDDFLTKLLSWLRFCTEVIHWSCLSLHMECLGFGSLRAMKGVRLSVLDGLLLVWSHWVCLFSCWYLLFALLHSLILAIKGVWLSVLDGLAAVIGLDYLHIMELVIWVAGFILYMCIVDAGYWFYYEDFQKYFVICSYWVMLAGLRICNYCYLE